MINKRLSKIERLLEKKEAWVGADAIMKATGWNKDEMYRMRKTGAIGFKKLGSSFLYDANSIPAIFIRNAIPN